jgi:prepilin-type N-terminal cleavage/methylation domain-containing protein
MKKNYTKGFTLIELLIVIAVLGILIVAILSAIDPLEQIRKARDAGRKSDAAELLSAYERYFSTFQCYPWDTGHPNCSTVTTASRTTATFPDMSSTTSDDYDLVTQGELKSQFVNRTSLANSELWVNEDASTRQSVICFEPESQSGRQGGYGTLFGDSLGDPASSVNCSGAYAGGGSAGTCYICLPQ